MNSDKYICKKCGFEIVYSEGGSAEGYDHYWDEKEESLRKKSLRDKKRGRDLNWHTCIYNPWLKEKGESIFDSEWIKHKQVMADRKHLRRCKREGMQNSLTIPELIVRYRKKHYKRKYTKEKHSNNKRRRNRKMR